MKVITSISKNSKASDRSACVHIWAGVQEKERTGEDRDPHRPPCSILLCFLSLHAQLSVLN